MEIRRNAWMDNGIRLPGHSGGHFHDDCRTDGRTYVGETRNGGIQSFVPRVSVDEFGSWPRLIGA
jgi:hypothetical protein